MIASVLFEQRFDFKTLNGFTFKFCIITAWLTDCILCLTVALVNLRPYWFHPDTSSDWPD